MSGIGANITGAIVQTQVVADQAAKTGDAQRNKRARDSRNLARLADQQQNEVEDTEHVDEERILRDGERQRENSESPYDSFEPQSAPSDNEPSETPKTKKPALSPPSFLPDEKQPSHIDISI